MVNNNLIFSLFALFISLMCTCFLFAGLLSAHWDYIVEHTEDAILVLILGTLIPISFITGLILLIRGTIRREPYAWLFIIISLCMMLIIIPLGGELFVRNVLKLYQIKLGL